MIRVFATQWCGDCRLAKRVLDEMGTEYEWIDIDFDAAAATIVQELNGGYRTVPTILFPDGRVLVEPTREQLQEALAA